MFRSTECDFQTKLCSLICCLLYMHVCSRYRIPITFHHIKLKGLLYYILLTILFQPVLYSYWRSSCSWRVRIALNLKEIPYDIKAVSLIKGGGEQHCNEYREVNPMEQVPSLCIGKIYFLALQ